jgi:cytochrome c oxidase subunit 2
MHVKEAILLALLLGLMTFGCTDLKASGGNDTGAAMSGKVVEINITAKQWEFVPSTITVKKGDTVRITATSVDVAHGLSIPEYGINQRLEPNVPVTVEFVADKSGTFGFRCSVMCGEGHRSMTGQLIVEE